MQVINQAYFERIGLSVFLFLSFSTLCISQTDVQKRKIYEGVYGFGEGEGIVSLIDHGLGEVDSLIFFSKSIILPVFKYNHDNKEWMKNPSLFIIIFKDRLFTYNEYSKWNFPQTSLKFDTPEVADIVDFIYKNRNSLRIGYLFDNYYQNISRDDLFYMDIERGTVLYHGVELSSIDELIINNFGSMEKYEELASLDNERSELCVEDIDKAIKNDYRNYMEICNKDTLFIIDILISQINSAIGRELGKRRSEILKEQILESINPIKYMLNKFPKKIQEEYYKQLKKGENRKSNNKKKDYFIFMIYDTDITESIVAVLTEDEFIKYMIYNDLYYPYSERYSARLRYGAEVLNREGKQINMKKFSKYIDNIINKKEYKCIN